MADTWWKREIIDAANALFVDEISSRNFIQILLAIETRLALEIAQTDDYGSSHKIASKMIVKFASEEMK